MSTIFKQFSANDVVPVRTLLYESIPITGSIVSGTYADLNVKTYSHGLFESVYDYPFLSSSANHIFDLTIGYHSSSALSTSADPQNRQKINMYNEYAMMFAGHDTTGSILQFDEAGATMLSSGNKMKECFFINFARLLNKDEIKKGSFNLTLAGFPGYAGQTVFQSILTITDLGAQNNFRVNSPVGEYAILSASAGGAYSGSSGSCGLIFYQAGVIVLTGSVFLTSAQLGGKLGANAQMDLNGSSVNGIMTGSITGACDALRHRIQNVSFNNTTELNSTVYFCRFNNNEFNYSANPTYLSGSKIVVKNSQLDAPVTYITTVGGYSADGELLFVGKCSEPIRKDPSIEFTLRCRLDY